MSEACSPKCEQVRARGKNKSNQERGILNFIWQSCWHATCAQTGGTACQQRWRLGDACSLRVGVASLIFCGPCAPSTRETVCLRAVARQRSRRRVEGDVGGPRVRMNIKVSRRRGPRATRDRLNRRGRRALAHTTTGTCICCEWQRWRTSRSREHQGRPTARRAETRVHSATDERAGARGNDDGPCVLDTARVGSVASVRQRAAARRAMKHRQRAVVRSGAWRERT